MSLTRRAWRHLKTVGTVVLGRNNAGRGVTVFPDDIFVVSYFRSGSTWSRFLIGNLIHENEPVTFVNIERLVPSIYNLPDRALRRLPRVLKSHECFDPRYPRVIYVVRDPRDVAVSFYYYCLKMGVIRDGHTIDDFVDRFLTNKIVDYADRHGCWQDHVLSWLRLREGKSGFKVVRYEDLLADPVRELANLAPMLGVDPTPSRIERAVRMSSATHMQSLEKEQSKQWGVTKDSRQDILFVREAKSGGWHEKLPRTSVRTIEQAWGPTMKELGYELVMDGEADRALVGR